MSTGGPDQIGRSTGSSKDLSPLTEQIHRLSMDTHPHLHTRLANQPDTSLGAFLSDEEDDADRNTGEPFQRDESGFHFDFEFASFRCSLAATQNQTKSSLSDYYGPYADDRLTDNRFMIPYLKVEPSAEGDTSSVDNFQTVTTWGKTTEPCSNLSSNSKTDDMEMRMKSIEHLGFDQDMNHEKHHLQVPCTPSYSSCIVSKRKTSIPRSAVYHKREPRQ